MKDYYSILGLQKTASQEEISKAYKELALKYHPDKNPDNLENATKKFKEVQEAFDALSDPYKKSHYDNFQNSAFQFRSRNAEDIFRAFSDFFEKTQTNGSKVRIKITLEEAYKGCEKIVSVYELETAKAKEIIVKIPPGIDEDTQIRIPNAGSDGNDLFVVATILKDDKLKREGKHLFGEIEVPYTTLVLGGKTTYKLFDSNIEIKIRPNTKTGSKIRLKGQGMPILRNPEIKGDLFVTINLKIPNPITEDHKKAIEKLIEFENR